MKDQYAGDVNDYVKYGLLRLLAGGPAPLLVARMLTPGDGRNDGRHTGYLLKPEQWRVSDPELFDRLRRWMSRSPERSVGWIEKSDLLPGARFYPPFLGDGVMEREEWFRGLNVPALNGGLIFFDPDNGMEVRSVPRGRKGSSKYLYWIEAEQSYRAGNSLLVYQHFPRVGRAEFCAAMERRFADQLHPGGVITFMTGMVAWFCVSRPEHLRWLASRARLVEERWKGIVKVRYSGR